MRTVSMSLLLLALTACQSRSAGPGLDAGESVSAESGPG